MKFTLLVLALCFTVTPIVTSGTQVKPAARKDQPPAKTAKTDKLPPAAAKAPPKTEVPQAHKQPEPEPTIDPSTDKERFEAAVAAPTHTEKAVLLKKFLEDFPGSELRDEAFIYMVTARSVAGGEKLKAGDMAEAVESFRLAVAEAPKPVPDRLFSDVIARIPGTLFSAGLRAESAELADLIEAVASGSVRQLLGVASFYLSVENSAEAIRIAEKAVELEPGSAAGHQALGFAHRLNFDLEAAARSFERAAALDPSLHAAQRGLAEMRRALGQHDEAISIYRSLLAADENDIGARSGLALALFDKGRQTEAEAELARVLERDTRNFSLRSAAAYWYASQGNGPKAVELAERAVEIEPRYIWGHIALARGMMKQGRPADAERALIRARQYGNFPTLEYEIASARMMAGFFREAAETLGKDFSIVDGSIQTKLGGRVTRNDKNFIDLLASERRASILIPTAADDPDAAARLRTLFELAIAVNGGSDEKKIARLADEFTRGEDNMAAHRKLHAAELLLQKNLLIPKAADLIRAAVGSAEKALDVPAPAAAVMASELYEGRALAFARNEVMLIPDVPKATLSAILRGRIEELSGWSLYLQGDNPGAAVRLRRSISVLPEKSAWWRSSMWRLGAALEADAKAEEALETYMKAYQQDRPNAIRYSIIAALYKRINGTTDGLEEKLGPNPLVALTGPAPAARQTVEVPEAKPPDSQTKTSEEAGMDKALNTSEKSDPAKDPAAAAASDSKPVEEKTNSQKEAVPAKDIPQTAPPKNDRVVSEGEKLETRKAAEPHVEDEKTETVSKEPGLIPSAKVDEKTADTENTVEEKEVKAAVRKDPDAEKPVTEKPVPTETVPEQAADEKTKTSETAKDGTQAEPVNLLRDPFGRSTTNDPKGAERAADVPAPATQRPLKEKAADDDLFVKEPGADKESVSAGSTRRRVVEGREIVSDQKCSIEVSQSMISLINGGGSLAVFVDVAGGGSAAEVKASPSSSRDIEVTQESAIAGSQTRRYFLVKSISTRTGLYQVNFESPCGKSEITVRVR